MCDAEPYSGALLKTTRLLLILVAGGWLLAVSAFAQVSEAAATKAADILGTVADVNGDPIPMSW
jgi:hypothetical protein